MPNNNNKYFIKRNGKEVVGTRSATEAGSWNCFCSLFTEYKMISRKRLEVLGFSVGKDKK